MKQVIGQAKKTGSIDIYCREQLYWNYEREILGVPVKIDVPLEDGTYDKMGLDDSDICAKFTYDIFSKQYVSVVFDRFKQRLSELYVIVTDKEFTLKEKFYYLEEIFRFSTPILSNKFDQWVWTVNSFDVTVKEIAFDIASDNIAIGFGYKDSTEYFEKTGKVIDVTKAQKLAQLILDATSKEDMLTEIETQFEYIKVKPYMWVSKNDPTVFMIDNYHDEALHFDMKDGWSYEKIARLIQLWFNVVHGLKIKVNLVEDDSWR